MTLAEVQRGTGCPEARVMPAVGTVTLHGEPVRADAGIDLDGICVVRADTGHWYVGDGVSDGEDVTSWGDHGPDLGTALRTI